MFFLLCLLPWMISAQNYVSKIIPTEFANVNAFNIYRIGDKYILGGTYNNNRSTIITMDDALDNFEYYHFDSITFSYRPCNLLNGNLFVFAKNMFLEKGLKLLRLNSDYAVKEQYSIPSGGTFDFPTSSMTLDGDRNIYGTYDYNNNSAIFKIGTDGSVRWNKTFDQKIIDKSIFWRLYPSKSNDLLGCYSVQYGDQINANVRAIKVDTAGNEIWKSDPLSDADVYFRASLAELSDSTIFLTYPKYMFLAPEYHSNWNIFPPTHIWLDRNGKKIRENIPKLDKECHVYISEAKAGRGDYFYIFGQLTLSMKPKTDYYGFITKYANNGDTIWTHIYRHEDYNRSDISHYIRDIIEEDNGDIVALGAVAIESGKKGVWVFRVNDQGCFGTDSCDELTLSEKALPVSGRTAIRLYPNPTTGIVLIDGVAEGDSRIVRIYDMEGRLLKQQQTQSQADLSLLPPGIYLIRVFSRHEAHTVKILKL